MEITVESGTNLGKICRACLSTKNNLTEMKENDGNYEKFLDEYQACTSVDLKEIDNLPLQICETCIRCVKEFNVFREMCRVSHTTIKTLVNKSDKIVTDDGNEIFVLDNNSDDEVKVECNVTAEEGINEELFVTQIKCYKCEICCESFEDTVILKQHQESLHCTNDYKCALCQNTFNNPSYLTEHIKVHDKTETNERKMKMFQCNRCEKPYKTIVNLQIHMYSHLGLKPFKCDFCPRAFTKQFTLNSHLSLHTGFRKFLCGVCGTGFTSALLLNRHESVHTGIRRHKCKFCPKTFAAPGDLTVHTRMHTGEKPYLCSTCGKAFRRINHLNVHKRIHTGERPYKCRYCHKAFTQSGDWRAHERIHTGEKPHVCTVCGKRFNQATGLTTHKKKHIPQSYTCEFCKKQFIKVGSYKRHCVLHEGATVCSSEN